MLRMLAFLALCCVGGPAWAGDVTFATVEQALVAGDKDGATTALVALVEDPSQAADHGRAWRTLAPLLSSYDLQGAALVAWSRAIALDPQGVGSSIGEAMDLAAELSDEPALAPSLAENVGVEGLDAETRSRMAYLAARHHLRRDSLGTALAILMMVDQSSKVFAEAEALRGVVLANQGRFRDAVAPLLTAQGAARQRPDSDPERAARFDDLMELNLARAHFGAGDWVQAIDWFDKVDRSSNHFPQARFEQAWAHFRNDDMRGTLAQLHTHGAPFFDDWYFPEADVLRAYALFNLCKFPSANAEMDAFVQRYTPVKEELDRTLPGLDAAAAFADAHAFVEGGQSKLPGVVLRGFRADDRFLEALTAVDRAQTEIAKAEALGKPFAQKASAWVAARRDALIAEEGQRVLDRARTAQTELAQMLQGVEITRLDVLQMEADMYERAAQTGHLDYGDRIGKLRKIKKARRGYRVWPFQGEYWADELGWFVVDARPDCPESAASR